MAKKPMSDTQLRHRKKAQAGITRTTSTLGLTGLGLLGAGVAIKKPKVAHAVHGLPGMHNVDAKKLESVAIKTGIVSSGIGGAGGFNTARIYDEDSKRKQGAVKKNDDTFEGSAARYIEEMEEFISKKWEPVSRNYDPEQRREKRGPYYEGAAVATAGYQGARAVGRTSIGAEHKSQGGAKAYRASKPHGPLKAGEARHFNRLKANDDVARAAFKGARKRGAVAVAAAGVAAGIHHERTKGSWQSYAKRDSVSAFGVDHTE